MGEQVGLKTTERGGKSGIPRSEGLPGLHTQILETLRLAKQNTSRATGAVCKTQPIQTGTLA